MLLDIYDDRTYLKLKLAAGVVTRVTPFEERYISRMVILASNVELFMRQ